MKRDNSISSFCVALVVTTVIVPGQPNEICAANASSRLLLQSSDRTPGHEHGIFEKYDNSKNARKRKERLDAFADYLKQNPHFQGYIMHTADIELLSEKRRLEVRVQKIIW